MAEHTRLPPIKLKLALTATEKSSVFVSSRRLLQLDHKKHPPNRPAGDTKAIPALVKTISDRFFEPRLQLGDNAVAKKLCIETQPGSRRNLATLHGSQTTKHIIVFPDKFSKAPTRTRRFMHRARAVHEPTHIPVVKVEWENLAIEDFAVLSTIGTIFDLQHS